MPSVKSIANAVARQRKLQGTPKLQPTCLKDLRIPKFFQSILREGVTTKFLQYDSGELDENRFIIWSTEDNFELMKQAKEMYANGTFAVTPCLFDQLYTIHVSISGTIYPVVFILMPNRKQSTYERMLLQIKELVPDFAPNRFVTDFEKGSINAYETVFPDAMQKGCFFHLSQAIWRHLQNIPNAKSL